MLDAVLSVFAKYILKEATFLSDGRSQISEGSIAHRP